VNPKSPEVFIPDPAKIDQADFAEKPTQLESIEFSIIAPGDQVLLYAVSGKAYLLSINEKNEAGELFAQLRVGTKLQLAPEIETWEDIPHRIFVKGICQRLRIENGEVFVEGEQPGLFKTGEPAWLGFSVDGKEKELLTPKVIKIEHYSTQNNKLGD